jgi:hypothetical protein
LKDEELLNLSSSAILMEEEGTAAKTFRLSDMDVQTCIFVPD